MNFVDYEGVIAAETDKAIQLRSEGGEEIWLPKEFVGRITYNDKDRHIVLVGESIEAIELEPWLAKDRGLL